MNSANKWIEPCRNYKRGNYKMSWQTTSLFAIFTGEQRVKFLQQEDNCLRQTNQNPKLDGSEKLSKTTKYNSQSFLAPLGNGERKERNRKCQNLTETQSTTCTCTPQEGNRDFSERMGIFAHNGEEITKRRAWLTLSIIVWMALSSAVDAVLLVRNLPASFDAIVTNFSPSRSLESQQDGPISRRTSQISWAQLLSLDLFTTCSDLLTNKRQGQALGCKPRVQNKLENSKKFFLLFLAFPLPSQAWAWFTNA